MVSTNVAAFLPYFGFFLLCSLENAVLHQLRVENRKSAYWGARYPHANRSVCIPVSYIATLCYWWWQYKLILFFYLYTHSLGLLALSLSWHDYTACSSYNNIIIVEWLALVWFRVQICVPTKNNNAQCKEALYSRLCVCVYLPIKYVHLIHLINVEKFIKTTRQKSKSTRI